VILGRPIFLLMFLILPFYIVVRLLVRLPSVVFSDTRQLKVYSHPCLWRVLLLLPSAVGFSFLFLALAQPRKPVGVLPSSYDVVDIMLVLDISGSMRAVDFAPKNRLESAKAVCKDFVKRRKGDRIGIVVFARSAYLLCPLTMDTHLLLGMLDGVEIGDIEDGTAIGMGLSVAVSALRHSKAKSKVIILLTDGRNNAGKISPLTAATLAKELGIRVYTVGIGGKGKALFPVRDAFGMVEYVPADIEMDEALLKEVANITGAEYFLASRTEELFRVYRSIDELERTKVKVERHYTYKEYFPYFILIGLLFIMLEVIARSVILP